MKRKNYRSSNLRKKNSTKNDDEGGLKVMAASESIARAIFALLFKDTTILFFNWGCHFSLVFGLETFLIARRSMGGNRGSTQPK